MGAYQMGVGQGAYERLAIVHEVIGPHSKRFLTDAGLRPGMTVLEVGCGAGHMTAWLAERVGPSGRVIAVDQSAAQIEVARGECARAGMLGNVEFCVGDAGTIELARGSVDLAYFRLVLIHSAHPAAMLAHVASFLAPTGILACDELAAGVVAPQPWDETFAKVTSILVKVARLRGQDLGVSARLVAILASLGHHPLTMSLVQPFVPFELRRRVSLLALQEGLEAALESGIVTRAVAEEIAREVRGLPTNHQLVAGTCHLQVATCRARPVAIPGIETLL